MAVARQNQVRRRPGGAQRRTLTGGAQTEDRLGRLEKEFAALQRSGFGAGIVSEYKAASAVTLPMFLTLIAVVGGSYFLLSERMTETTMQVNMRIDDTNNLIKIMKSDLEKDIGKLESSIDGIESSINGIENRIDGMDAKLDRLLLR